MPAPFTLDYRLARERFRAAAFATGARLWTLPVAGLGPRGEALAVDVAELGDSDAPAVLLVSSGIHGVEGPVGSAVQTTWLARRQGRRQPRALRVVLVHALNPWGFAHARRTDADNVDLNRNFLLPRERYRGEPEALAGLAAFAAPRSPTPPFDAFHPRAVARLAEHGWRSLRDALISGQHEHPQGLFFGGLGETESARIVRTHCGEWLGTARRVLHLDLHSGLGRYGGALLLALCAPDSPSHRWLRRTFPSARIVAEGEPARTGEAWRGTMGRWLALVPGAERERYVFGTLEFGTAGPLAVFAAMRAENRAWWQADAHLPAARRRLWDAFAPPSSDWRQRVSRHGAELIDNALAAWC